MSVKQQAVEWLGEHKKEIDWTQILVYETQDENFADPGWDNGCDDYCGCIRGT